MWRHSHANYSTFCLQEHITKKPIQSYCSDFRHKDRIPHNDLMKDPDWATPGPRSRLDSRSKYVPRSGGNPDLIGLISPRRVYANQTLCSVSSDGVCDNSSAATLHMEYRQISNIRRPQSQNINVSRPVLQFALSNPLKPCVKLNEDLGGAPTGDAPTTCEWSTILLPTKVRLILETWRYWCFPTI